MMFRTHLAFGLFLALAFLSYAQNKILFFIAILISTLLPDIDSMHSYLGRKKIFRPIQWAAKHRGFFHSLVFCVIMALFFAFFYPVLALPFFLGYAGHLLMDSFTDDGIRPFWPSKKELRGFIRTGGRWEKGLLYALTIADIAMAVWIFI